MKKILVFSTDYLPHIGGAELAISHIARHSSEYEFHLITSRLSSDLSAEEVIEGVYVYRVGFGIFLDKFLIPLTGFFKAVLLHRRMRFDIVWSMMASQASIAAALFKVTHKRVPLVLTLQEGDEEEHLKRYVFGNETLYRIFVKPFHVFVFKVADLITVISKHLEARARLKNRAVPIVLVPNGVSLEAFSLASKSDVRIRTRSEFGFSDSDSVVVTVSRLVEKNRVDTLVRAIAALPVSYKLLVAGEGHLENELKNLVGELGVTSRVVFAGRVIPKDVPRILSAADVFARPSASEGFGSAFLEAMAAGVPVVATQVGGITDFVKDKETGLFCTVGDADDLARKITVLTRDQILRAEIIERALKLVREKYDWSMVSHSMHTNAFRPLLNLHRERILIATGIYPPAIGGPATYALALRDAFWSRGYAVQAVTYGFEKKLPLGIRHFVYFLRILFPTYSSDWVIGLDTFSSGIPALLASKILRRKIIVRTGGDFLWEQYVERTGEPISLTGFYKNLPELSAKERFIFRITRFSLRHIDGLVFSTQWQRSLWKEPYGFPMHKSLVIENFYAPQEEALEPIRKNILFAGRAIALKNFERFKRAFAAAQKKDPALSLESMSVPHNVLMERIRESYAVAIPSLSEISPNLALEAVRFGKPFLITEHFGLRDRIGKLGVLIDPRSEKSMEKGILELADTVRYAELKKLSREFSFVHSWDDIAGEITSFFETL